MTKHWTKDEDEFVHSYSEIGDFIGSHDLGRKDSSIGPRVRKLKACGAWDALTVQKMAEGAYTVAIGARREWDDDDLRICSWMARNAHAIIAKMEAGVDIELAEPFKTTIRGAA